MEHDCSAERTTHVGGEQVARREAVRAQISQLESLQDSTQELALVLSASVHSCESPEPWLPQVVGLLEPLLKDLSDLPVPEEHVIPLSNLQAELSAVLTNVSSCSP